MSEKLSGGLLLRGTSVAPGLVLGTVHRKEDELSLAQAERLPSGDIEAELERFRAALELSGKQLRDLRGRVVGRIDEDDARILDTHLAYLKDSAFVADVENLIRTDRMKLEAAIAKVIGDFDRIFRLVENEALRQSAVDLRDVGIRVLRNLDWSATTESSELPPDEYILAARELSIVDMFDLSNQHVRGIITEEGGLTSHAAIFARSMRIPTVTGVEGLLESVREGDFVILDATEGTLRVNPDELVRKQFSEGQAMEPPGDARLEAGQELQTRDGEGLFVAGSAGNLPEVEQALECGVADIGLYRTELLYLVDRELPSAESLRRHYESVLEKAPGEVTFRLLNVDSSSELEYLYPNREANPQLGRVGVRILLEHPNVLRRQLRAMMLAGSGRDLRIAVPFVTDTSDLRRVREIVFEEKLELKKSGAAVPESLAVGVVIETPASLLGMRDLASEAEFLCVNLDAMQQFVLAVDRESSSESLKSLHPFVVRALRKLVHVCGELSRELSVFGVSASAPANLTALIGVGVRRFSVAPAALAEFARAATDIDGGEARQSVEQTAALSCQAEVTSRVSGYHHGQR